MAKSSASKSGSEHEPDSLDGEVVSPSICDGNGDEPVESKAELAPNRREDIMIKKAGDKYDQDIDYGNFGPFQRN